MLFRSPKREWKRCAPGRDGRSRRVYPCRFIPVFAEHRPPAPFAVSLSYVHPIRARRPQKGSPVRHSAPLPPILHPFADRRPSGRSLADASNWALWVKAVDQTALPGCMGSAWDSGNRLKGGRRGVDNGTGATTGTGSPTRRACAASRGVDRDSGVATTEGPSPGGGSDGRAGIGASQGRGRRRDAYAKAARGW